MKKLIAALVLVGMTSTAALAGPIRVVNPAPVNELLIYMPDPEVKAEPVCFGCISEVTGLPRTHYVRPYTRSNGTYVNGYYRSRR